MANANTKADRPLSPHLQIYRWQMTMAMSIAHRVTGVGLYFGLLLFAVWVLSAAMGPGPFAVVNGIYTSWPGLLILFGFTWALFHHLLGGLRHFVWDTGWGLDKPARDTLAIGNLVASIVLTVLFWVVVLWLR